VYRQLNRVVMFGAVVAWLLWTPSADAYIGPGAGLSLLGALWALIAAIAAALGFIVMWPFRRARKRRAARKEALAAQAAMRDIAPDALHETPDAPAR